LSRLPVAAFAALVAATIGAFFVTQHLKVTTPLITGIRAPVPGTINPVSGTVCGRVDYRRAKISFYLLNRPDDVDVYVTDPAGTIIRTISAGRHMRRAVRNPDGNFYWNGREDNGHVAPDGTYLIEVSLIHQGRTVVLSNPAGPFTVKVKTRAPRPRVQSVTPHLIPARTSSVTIRYSGNETRLATVLIYRTDLPGPPRLVKQFVTKGQTAVWDGKIDERPAPPGIYLVGLQVTDAACHTGRFPRSLPPAPGSTPAVGVTVSYISAQPPLDPVSAGSTASVGVDARGLLYRWVLRRAGAVKPVASGSSRHTRLSVPLPRGRAGLYALELSAAGHSITVPLTASAPTDRRTLVVLPSLTWEGLNPVDTSGDGLPTTLLTSDSIRLNRPLTEGLPAGLSDEGGLLAYLDASHHPYQLTTDLGLVDGVGPRLAGHRAVVLAGTERWIPASLSTALRAFVERGGRVLSLGIDSLRRQVTVTGGRAVRPTGASRRDALAGQPGALIRHNTRPLTAQADQLGIFQGTTGSFPGYADLQPMTVTAPGQLLSDAAAGSAPPSIVGYQLGVGTVIDIGLQGFGSTLGRRPDARKLIDRIWTVLSS
jgi:hypothetical protein